MRGRDLGGMGGPGNRWHSALAEAKVYVFFLVDPVGPSFFLTLRTVAFFTLPQNSSDSQTLPTLPALPCSYLLYTYYNIL